VKEDRELLRQKLDQATNILEELGIDLWLTLARETAMLPDPALDFLLDTDVTWLSAFLVSRSGRHTAIVGYYDGENVRQMGLYRRVVAYNKGLGKHLLSTLNELNPAQIALNYSQGDVAADGLTVGNYRTLLGFLTGTPYGKRLISAERIIAALRGRKNPTEVNRIRHVVVITEKLFDEVETYVQPGMTQRQIAHFVHKRIDDMGLEFAWKKQYNPIVTCGPHSSVGHVTPGDVPLEKGHTLHLDLGIKQDGYCSDLQRMWYVLEEDQSAAPPDVQHAFEAVSGAIRAGERVLRPGVPGWQVDAAARQFIIDAGYPEYMHAFGHLLGRSAHDGATVLGPRWERYDGICELPVEVGHVFTLELHVPVTGRGIMSLEEDVLVTDSGVQYLSTPQRKLRYISQ
jgi:Xaa-Pro aminopeptidase